VTAKADALDILAIAAHRDDVEQTCGGTLLKMTLRGFRTGILDLTKENWGRVVQPKNALARPPRQPRFCAFPGDRLWIFQMDGWKTPGKTG